MTDRLDEIRRRLEAATPGPWKRFTPDGFAITTEDVMYGVISTCHKHVGDDPDRVSGNAEFIAYAPEDIAYLLAEVEARDEKLHQISLWANAYPADIFIEPDLKKTAEVLKAAGISMGGLHGSWGRHITEGIREILNGAT